MNKFTNRALYYWSKACKKIKGSAIINSKIDRTSKVEAGSHIVNSTFEKHSFCGYDCEIIDCEIGSFCSIANNVKIGGGAHPIDWVSTSPVFYEGRDSVKAKFSKHRRESNKKTIIGHDVWIGQSAIVKQGVRIGTGAVIGMGSVVTKDVSPYTIVVGVPAKELRKRFNEDIINELLELEWWDFGDDKLSRFAKYINNPVEFIKELNK